MTLIFKVIWALKWSKLAKNGLFRAITRHAFELGSPNLHQMCIIGPSRTLLKMVLIDHDLQGHLDVKTTQIREKQAFGAITRHVFELGLPNLHQFYIMGLSKTLLKMV